jgi:ADP-heptose:LPS heptosyltransferase
LIESGRRVTVAGIDSRRGLGRFLAQNLGDSVEFLQAAPLAGALPLLAAHRSVVAADGSLPHLAAHAGATCITLFGPNDPAWKRPLGRRHAVVRRHVECAPCLLAKCPLDQRCQNELDTDRVWQAVQGGLGQWSGR